MHWLSILGIVFAIFTAVFSGLGAHFSAKSADKISTVRHKELVSQNQELRNQNDELFKQVSEYKEQNRRLKEDVRKERVKTFDLGTPDLARGGISIRSREGSLAAHFNKSLDLLCKAYLDYDTPNEQLISEATETLELMTEAGPTDARGWCLHAFLVYLNGDASEAKDLMSRAAQIDPTMSNNVEFLASDPPTAEVERQLIANLKRTRSRRGEMASGE